MAPPLSPFAMPPFVELLPHLTRPAQAQNVASPSMTADSPVVPLVTLRHAEWNDRNPSPNPSLSPVDQKRCACDVCDKRFEKYAGKLAVHSVADYAAGPAPPRPI